MPAADYNRRQIETHQLLDAHLAQLVSFWQEHHGLAVDGKAGPATIRSLDEAMGGLDADDYDLEPPDPVAPSAWAPFDGHPFARVPRVSDVLTCYGDPRAEDGSLSKQWERAHMILARNLPTTPQGKLYCHRLVEPALREALRRAQLAAPDYKIEKIGCFNFRPIRFDRSRGLSHHSWGIAVDINPRANRGVSFARNKSPEAWSAEWNTLWPDGMPEPFVRAWQSCGWSWGGDWDSDGTSADHRYIDPMHFELVDRRAA